MSTEAVSLKALQTIPNIGKSLAKDLYDLGYREPGDLKGKDPVEMYQRLCALSGTQQDPCVLDTLMSAVHYANTGEAKKWWEFTNERRELNLTRA